MARDIEEFLRKAAERRQQQQAEKQGGAVPRKKPAKQPTARQPQRPMRQVPQPGVIQAVEVTEDDIIEARPVKARASARSDSHRTSVQSDVQSHIDTSKFDRDAEGLGRLRAQMTDDVDEVKQKFDRGAKKFQSTREGGDTVDSEIVGQDVSALATDLIQMLRDPKSIQQAILVSEILRRPDFDDEL